MSAPKRACLFLDLEAAVDQDSYSDESDQGVDDFIDDDSEVEEPENSETPIIPIDTTSGQEESQFIQDLAKRWVGKLCKRPSNKVAVPEPSSANPHPMAHKFSASGGPSAIYTSSEISPYNRTPHPAGKRSRLTGLPIPKTPSFHSVIRGDELLQKNPYLAPSSSLPSLVPKSYIPKRSSNRRQLMSTWSTWASRSRAQDHVPLRELTQGEWVIIKRGKYQRDAGVIWKKEDRSNGRGYLVLVVPRTNTRGPSQDSQPGSVQGKRKRDDRAPPMLFDSSKYAGITKEGPQTYRFNQKTYSYGLLVKYFLETALYPANFLPDELEDPFTRSSHPILARFPPPLPSSWTFEPGDCIFYHQPLFPVGLRGTLVEYHPGERYCVVDFSDSPSENQESRRVVSVRHLTKIVQIGDHVRVESGQHVGKEGVVLERTNNIVGIMESNGSRTNADFFTNVNTVTKTPPANPIIEDIPWRNLAVMINQESEYFQRKGLIKDVLRDKARPGIFLSIYVLDFDLVEQFRYTEVVEYITHQPLLTFSPLTPTQKKRFGHYDNLYSGHTGNTPWNGIAVHVISGQHKGTRGYVRDARKIQWNPQVHSSSIVLTVESQKFTAGAVNPSIIVNYLDVRELVTGKHLAKYKPLMTSQVGYYAPKFASNANVHDYPYPYPITNSQRNESAATPLHAYEPEPVSAFLDYNDAELSSRDQRFIQQVLSITLEPEQSDPGPTSVPEVDVAPACWIQHRNLVNIPIYVKIEGREHILTPKLNFKGQVIVRLYEKDGVTDLDPKTIESYTERPNPATCKELLVIARGRPEHIGKLGRQINYFFYPTREENDRWFILGIIDRSGDSEVLTEERVDVHPRDLEWVEETTEDKRHSKNIFKAERDLSRKGQRPGIREPVL